MNLAAEIRAERVRAVFEQAPSAAFATTMNALLMTAVLGEVEGERGVFVWLLAVLGVVGARVAMWRAFSRASPDAAKMRRWAIASTCGAFASGILWGGGALLLFPQDQALQLFWIFAIGGMCAGATAVHAAHLPTLLAFILPASLLAALRFLLQGGEPSLVAGSMIVVFACVLASTGRRCSRQFGQTRKLQLDLAQRTAELDASNARLRSEMAEHQATEMTLRHVQKMEAVGQLTGGIAHDFNNLLTAVLGNLELLRQRLPSGDEKARRLLDNAERGAERGAAVTQRLLAFGRRQSLVPEAVDLPLLVSGMSDLLRSSLGAQIRVTATFPSPLAPALADANQLELALLNLALNARDAMPQGGNLTITARAERVDNEYALGVAAGDYVVVAVLDTGEGMDEATLARATEPFFTTKGVGKGTGLGLSMVHGFAAQSGGKLVLQSRRASGTRAELWLPVTERRASVVRGAPDITAPAQATQATVLLVDDDALVLSSTAALLDDVGHNVQVAESGPRALDILQNEVQVDLVITDYAMPGMTGTELAREVRRVRPELPVLLVSGYADLGENVPTGLPRLAKPFGRKALIRAIEDVLHGVTAESA